MKLLVVFIAVYAGYVLGPNNVCTEEIGPLNIGAFHFPPMQYDNVNYYDKETEGLAGISEEINRKVFPMLGLKYKTNYFPPSRLFHIIEQEKIDIFAAADFIGKKYNNTYYCSNTVQTIKVVLYQNLSLSKEHEDLKKELIGKSIWVPKESREFFKTLVSKTNKLRGLVLPKNLVNTFNAQRSPYIIDYEERAEQRFLVAPPPFKFKRYTLLKLRTIICIRKSLSNSTKILDKLYKTWINVANSDWAKPIYEKYNYTPLIGPQHQ